MNLVTENQLDNWVRGNAQHAQGLIVELVWRLVAASCPNPRERRFPLGDSIGQQGPDGILDTSVGFDPFVPEGRSIWEIGTSQSVQEKATDDYRERTKKVPESVRAESAFVFVTPLSGVRSWAYSWNEDAQAEWLQQGRSRNEWKDVRIVDGTKLIDWLRQFPAVALWLAHKIHGPAVDDIEVPEYRWETLRSAGNKVLSPDVFLTNRDEACAKLKEVFDDRITQLTFTTNFPSQVTDFVCAYLASLEPEERVSVAGRCLVMSGLGAWNAVCRGWHNLILIAEPTIDLSSDAGARAIQEARKAGHAVIYPVPRGGVRDSATSAALPRPGRMKLQEALEKSGYPDHKARTIAEQCGGDLSTMLRIISGHPVLPAWSDGPDGSLLASAVIPGSWSDDSEADRAIVSDLTGEEFGKWIAKVREVSLSQETPIFHHEGVWKFISRFEAWLVLGRRVFDDDLDKLCETATKVLREPDPRFELPANERWLANISEKVLSHSHHLRKGLADTLALLGSHPRVLTSCTKGKAEYVARRAVRQVLCDADWVLWGSLDRLLPTLAEASPDEFLEAVDNALQQRPCPFDELFSQEGPGIFGANHLTGLLWALETLAWEEACFFHVCVVLGKLAERDPGGSWGNRPADSLARILLPWLPQTLASPSKRQSVLRTLLTETPEAAWDLLLSLMPSEGQISHPTHRPVWRETIPNSWSEGVTREQHWDQISFYADLAVEMAEGDVHKSIMLIDHLSKLPPSAVERFLVHLASESVSVLPEEQRVGLSSKLTAFAKEHREFSEAHWAMEDEIVTRIECIARNLAPMEPLNQHQGLFSWSKAGESLAERRQMAIVEILSNGGVDAVVRFAKDVEVPGYVGDSLGRIADAAIDTRVLPSVLESDDQKVEQFARSYVRRRQRDCGWEWADGLDRSQWTSSQIGQFLTCLPFGQDTWMRASEWLGECVNEYWDRPGDRIYHTDGDYTYAVGKFMEFGNYVAAVYCLDYNIERDGQPFDARLAIQALMAAGESGNPPNADAIKHLIEALQEHPETNQDDLFKVECLYLPLYQHREGLLKTIGHRLASDPALFCDAIRLIHRPKGAKTPASDSGGSDSSVAERVLGLLWSWRIPPGTRRDGSYSPQVLEEWLAQVRDKCEESGRWAVAQSYIGRVFIHSPADPDGLWLHRAVASALNAEDAQELRTGYEAGLVNARGAQWVDPTGKPERELSVKYRKKADEVESAGYFRLATSLRGIADWYSREADSIVENNSLPDEA